MLLGHFGVAFAAKKAAPKVSLGTLFVATLFLDLNCISFILFGIEKIRYDPGNTAVTPIDFVHFPFSHSLLATLVWTALFVAIYRKLRPHSKGVLWVGLLIISHWVLDFISHGPDLALYPGNTLTVGLGLWNSVPATLITEGLLFASGVLLYLQSTKAKDKIGTVGFWGLIFCLTAMYFVVVFALGEPTNLLLGLAAFGLNIIIGWAYWLDSHRVVRL